MRLDTHLSQRMDQRMILAPRMIQSMEILQLPIMALQERIQQELQENPVLELKDAPGDEQTTEEETPAPAATEPDATNPEKELVIDETGNKESDFDRLEAFDRDWEDRYAEEHRPSRNGMDEEGDKKHDAMQNMPSRPQSGARVIDQTPESLVGGYQVERRCELLCGDLPPVIGA